MFSLNRWNTRGENRVRVNVQHLQSRFIFELHISILCLISWRYRLAANSCDNCEKKRIDAAVYVSLTSTKKERHTTTTKKAQNMLYSEIQKYSKRISRNSIDCLKRYPRTYCTSKLNCVQGTWYKTSKRISFCSSPFLVFVWSEFVFWTLTSIAYFLFLWRGGSSI